MKLSVLVFSLGLSVLLEGDGRSGCTAFLVQSHPKRSSSTTTLNFFNFNKPDEEEAKEENDEPKFEDPAYDESDPVEKIFGFFFGKREEEPLGLGTPYSQYATNAQQFPQDYNNENPKFFSFVVFPFFVLLFPRKALCFFLSLHCTLSPPPFPSSFYA
mmetsp:Transcript_2147/g.3115  ORF Transcript_2147/g.3115 Transcript_2147/m.3115 type:complete len:158 (-) Transcript_2147:137-610(-)